MENREQEEEEEFSHPRANPVLQVLVVFALVACCGLPFLVIAAGGLSISIVLGGNGLFVAGATIAAIVLLAIIGIALRGRNKRRRRIKLGE